MKLIALAVSAAVLAAPAGAQTLKASHQFPGGKNDARDEMVQMIAREVGEANVGLDIRVYAGESLYKAKEQWGALQKGQLDISSFPLDYASGRVPQFSITLMPGLVRNHERAARLNASPFMEQMHKLIEDNGAIVLSDAWLSGGFVSKKNCITNPESIKGQVSRAAGPSFEEMLSAAGASISSMPSSEIYTGMQTGVLDGASTSSGSLVSYRLQEQAKCVTVPGQNALWFMYEPVLVSKRTWDKLTPEQQKALTDAGQKAEEWFAAEAPKLDAKMEQVFKDAGVEIATMSAEDYDAWVKLAQQTAFKTFADKVEGGQALLDAAQSVQ